FFPQFIVGWMGMPRRYHYYYFAPEYQPYHIMSSLGASVLALGLTLPAFYLTYSLFKGKKASANPWGAHGLEWTVPSPPPTTNFTEIPIVTDEVYDFDPVAEYEQQRGTQEIIHPTEPKSRITKEGEHLSPDPKLEKKGE